MSRCPLIIVDLPLKAIVMEIICLILRDLPLYQAWRICDQGSSDSQSKLERQCFKAEQVIGGLTYKSHVQVYKNCCSSFSHGTAHEYHWDGEESNKSIYATVRNCLEILFILGNLLLDSCLQIWEQIGLWMNEFWMKKKKQELKRPLLSLLVICTLTNVWFFPQGADLVFHMSWWW